MPVPTKTIIEALYTEQTCGDACWHAKEDICRCSCGGKNHGCLRTEDGEQPNRTRRIKDMMYQLVAVSPSPETCEAAIDAYSPIDKLHHAIVDKGLQQGRYTHGDIYYAECYRMKNLPCITKTATDGEIARWPELSAWRNSGKWFKPLTLWVRADMIDLASEVTG